MSLREKARAASQAAIERICALFKDGEPPPDTRDKVTEIVDEWAETEGPLSLSPERLRAAGFGREP
jgi:hypothetical protein